MTKFWKWLVRYSRNIWLDKIYYKHYFYLLLFTFILTNLLSYLKSHIVVDVTIPFHGADLEGLLQKEWVKDILSQLARDLK